MNQTIQAQQLDNLSFDLKGAVTESRLAGLWRLMKGYRVFYVAAVLSMALGAGARTFNYLVLSYVIDSVIAQGLHAERLPWYGLAFVGLAAFEGLMSYLRGVWSARTSEGVTLRLRDYLFDHVQRLPFAYHDHAKTGELIQRATSDMDTLRRFYADQAVGIGRIVALFAVNLTMLLRLNVQLGLLSVVIMPVVVAVSVYFFGRVSKAYERFQEQEAVLSTKLQENLTGVRVVRAFARQAHEREGFERENWKKYVLGKDLTMMHSAYWPISDTLCAAQMLLVMGVGAVMAINGQITLGTYVAMTGMVVWIVWPLRNLGRLIVQVSTGLVSYRRVADIIAQDREDIEAGVVRILEPVRGEVAFENVSFAYRAPPQIGTEKADKSDEQARRGKKWRLRKKAAVQEQPVEQQAAEDEPAVVLHDLSFHCQPGQVVALLGSTGSGKTSIVNLLLRFYDYDRGSIRLDGHELRDYAPAELRHQIGIVEQEPFLFSRTIRENIAYGVRREVSQDEIEAAAKAAAIHDIILTFPNGYDTLVGEKGVTLSGGQRQRVAIARTLLRDPRILILDDATSSVDTETEAQIRAALERLMRGRTSFVIAHRVQSVMNADLILVLDKGRIIQQGTHEELVSQPGMYARIYDLQARIEQELEREVAHVS